MKHSRVSLYTFPMWDTTMPPFALASLAEYLRRHDIAVDLFDINISMFREVAEDLKPFWDIPNLAHWQVEQPQLNGPLFERLEPYTKALLDRLHSDPNKLMGFSVTRSNALYSRFVLQRFLSNKQDRTIVLGGHHCANQIYRDFFKELPIDFYVEGEGEEPILRIARGEAEPGVVSARSNLDLNSLGITTFTGLDTTLYTTKRFPTFLGRGCICKCRFCEDFVINGKYRYRKPELAMQELRYVMEHHDVEEFLFVDLLLNGNSSVVEHFADLIIAEGLQPSWFGLFVINPKNDLNFFKKMKAAGCTSAVFGVEHFSDAMLRKMHKSFRAEDIPVVLERAKQAGLRVGINLIVGYPGETEEDFRIQVDGIHRYNHLIDGIGNVNSFVLVENTPIVNKIEEWGIKTNPGWRPATALWWDNESIYEERQERLEVLMQAIAEYKLGYYNSTLDTSRKGKIALPASHKDAGEEIWVDGGAFFNGNQRSKCDETEHLVIDSGDYPNYLCYKVRPQRPGRYYVQLAMAAGEPTAMRITWQGQEFFRTDNAFTGGGTRENLQLTYFGEIGVGKSGGVIVLEGMPRLPSIDGLRLLRIGDIAAQ